MQAGSKPSSTLSLVALDEGIEFDVDCLEGGASVEDEFAECGIVGVATVEFCE